MEQRTGHRCISGGGNSLEQGVPTLIAWPRARGKPRPPRAAPAGCAARLAAASLIAALATIEEAATAHMEQDGRGLTAAEIDRLLDDAVAFVHAGVAAVATG